MTIVDTTRCGATRSPKVALILDAAFELFLARGFDPVSTDLIAKTAGVSKATLYAHFASKEALFSEILIGHCADFSARVRLPETYEGDLAGTLRRFALDMISLFQNDRGAAMYRLIIGEVHRFPEIARAFEAAGPAKMNVRVVRLLRQVVERGELRIEDFDLAADQFTAMLMGRILFDRAMGLPPLPQAAIDRQIDAAIDLFLKGYGTARGEDRADRP